MAGAVRLSGTEDLTLPLFSFIFLCGMTLPPPPDGQAPIGSPFVGQTIAFTGKLSLLGRKDAQALVEHLGGTAADQVTSRTTMLVVGAAGFSRTEDVTSSRAGRGEAEKSNKLRKAEEANAKLSGNVRILSEEDFCKLGGLPTDDSSKQGLYRLRDIRVLYPTVRDDRLRYLEKWGLIRSVVRTNADTYYRFRDLLVIKQASAELERRAPFRAVMRSLLAAREGQLALDFRPGRSDAQPAKVVELARRRSSESSARDLSRVWRRGLRPAVAAPESALAAQYFCEAAELDEGDEPQQQQALIAYRKALVLDPNLVPALVNLANIHYARDELVEAQALYERALNLETECFEARFNLGNIHHDLGQYGEAVTCYQDALDLSPTYADAHFYLAVTLEKLGESKVAKPHWRAYQQLAPNGEWVDLARELSE